MDTIRRGGYFHPLEKSIKKYAPAGGAFPEAGRDRARPLQDILDGIV